MPSFACFIIREWLSPPRALAGFMHPNLSFEQAPPMSVPFRFFLTAPWFGVLAGLLLLWEGPQVLASRWTPEALGLTHLLVAGFMLQAMTGALFQFIPVATGGNIWRPRWIAGITHPLLALGALLLVAAFLGAGNRLFLAAAHTALLGVVIVVAATGWAMWKTPASGATVSALRLAILGLAVTAALGFGLAYGLGRGRSWPLIEMANVHAAWGLGGWGLMLLAGVSYYVVPMFQLTPAYPPRLSKLLPLSLVGLLLVWSAQLNGVTPAWQQVTLAAGMLVAAIHALITLNLQRQRRRKIPDCTHRLFLLAMAALLAVAVSVVLGILVPEIGLATRFPVWVGVLVIPGVFLSVITGMLYKIMPFIVWLHLQRLGSSTVLPPNMKKIIPERLMAGQMWAHFASVATLLGAVWLPLLARPAGALLALSSAWLGWNLMVAVRNYVHFKDHMLSASPGHGS